MRIEEIILYLAGFYALVVILSGIDKLRHKWITRRDAAIQRETNDHVPTRQRGAELNP